MDMAERQKMIEAIQQFRLIDDVYFSAFFDGDKVSMELVLRIILGKPSLHVVEMRAQNEVPNMYGRAVRFDVFATDDKNNEYNIEVQRSDEGANPRRARYNSSMMDTMNVSKGTEWKDIPPVIVIFITEHDVLGGGLPLYHVERVIREMGDKSFGDASEIVYVNAEIQDDTPLGKLMHDFFCKDANDMNYRILADRTKFFKTDEHGVSRMCKIMEDIKNEGVAEGMEKGMKAGRKEGRKEGVVVGREEARGDMVTVMLKDCAPIGKIEQYTGWTNEKIRDFASRNNLTVY
ncbi:MAG: Rpn family recombination-promoting nuclease/putative transposase [Selenomonadaceae bacterium]